MTEHPERLARLLQRRLGISFSRAKDEVTKGHVTINDALATDPGEWVLPTDRIEHRPELPRRRLRTGGPTIEILHYDQHLVVVDKPPGVLVHPTVSGEQDTVLARTAAALGRLTAQVGKLYIVHRLDQETSGAMVLARSHGAAQHLQRQFRAHTTTRSYLAIVAGDVSSSTRVDRSIGRPRPAARRAALAPGRGKDAVTTIEPLERFEAATLVEARLGTGRTHQVRVHLSYLGHPVLGDPLYGAKAPQAVPVPRLALHAKLLAFTHPVTGRRLEFVVPLPADLGDPLRRLRARGSKRSPPEDGARRRVRPDRQETAAAKRMPLQRSGHPREGALGSSPPRVPTRPARDRRQRPR